MPEMIPSAEQQAEAMALQREIYAAVDGRDVNVALNSLVHAMAILLTSVAKDPRQAARDVAAQLVVSVSLLADKQSGRTH